MFSFILSSVFSVDVVKSNSNLSPLFSNKISSNEKINNAIIDVVNKKKSPFDFLFLFDFDDTLIMKNDLHDIEEATTFEFLDQQTKDFFTLMYKLNTHGIPFSIITARGDFYQGESKNKNSNQYVSEIILKTFKMFCDKNKKDNLNKNNVISLGFHQYGLKDVFNCYDSIPKQDEINEGLYKFSFFAGNIFLMGDASNTIQQHRNKSIAIKYILENITQKPKEIFFFDYSDVKTEEVYESVIGTHKYHPKVDLSMFKDIEFNIFQIQLESFFWE
jgi:hypothetical protein